MKPKVVIGNWKMNKSFDEAEDLISDIEDALDGLNINTLVVLSPPYLYLELTTDHAAEANFECAAQNCSQFKNGAYTGEISANMLADLDVEFCIIGHSERRKYFGETNAILAEKVNRLTEVDMIPVYCCGEVVEERKAGTHFEVVEKQIKEGLFHLSPEAFERVIIAYEPVWAIGTGLTATPQQAEEMHLFIRSLVEKKYGTEIAYNLHIIYGGSCNPSNALELFSQPNVDGGLIGGASLKAEDFVEIVEAAETVGKEN
ncbi:MAG: triose-phosphate isomerase [Bacteroidales bacterium]|jgi:triosephosphate isomerase|nr:triose-phosphate isomerase [Bacteroidales bacterium]